MSRFFRLGLIGYALGHSRSPRLHQAALQTCGLEGEYKLYPIPPLPGGQAELEALLDHLRRGELDGLNVTIPHKRSVLPLVDRLTPTAQATGAVNTLFRSGGQLCGDNTDVDGFWGDLQDQAARWLDGKPVQPGKALVLGAGGAARAVVYALSQHGWQVHLAARCPEQAANLADDLGRFTPPPVILELPLAESASRLAQMPIDLLVNATPVGMHPNHATSPWPLGLALPEGCLVYDLVYNPPETPLLRQAKQQGLPAVNGWGMLVRQAAQAFMLWTNLPAEKLADVQRAMSCVQND